MLLSRLHKLVAREKQTTLSILLHLAEVERRDLYLEYGFSSLFDYCVGALGYSRSAAGRRIATARCVYRYPEIFDLLDSGEVNLSTVGLVAPVLDAKNKDLLFGEIKGKTQRQVESIVARYKPPVAYRDRVRPVRVAVPPNTQNPTNRRNPLIFNSRCGSTHRSNSGIVESDGREGRISKDEAFARLGSQPSTKPIGDLTKTDPRNPSTSKSTDGTSRIEKRLLIQFLASEAFMGKLDEVKSLLSNKMPGATFEEVFEAVMDEFIDRHSPEARHKRREKRRTKKLEEQNEKQDREPKRKGKADGNKRRNDKQKPTGKGGAVGNERRTEKRQPAIARMGAENKRTRHISAEVKDTVFKRDGGKCTFIGKDNKRCNSTWGLEIDHVKPFAKGGGNTKDNLRLLCGRHNRLAAEKVYGKGFMEGHYKRE